MGDATEGLGNSGMVEISGEIIIVSFIVLFVVLVFVVLIHLYAKWYWNLQPGENGNTTRRRRRLDFAPTVTALQKGLEPSLLNTLPVAVFSSQYFKDGLECAVCICDVSEGEKVRLLPICNHGFHVDCIDMWFQSHSTCPLCRNPVSEQPPSSSGNLESQLNTLPSLPIEQNSSINGHPTDSPNFPTNVLFWGNETQVRTLGPLEEISLGPSPPQSSCSTSSSAQPASSSNRGVGTLAIEIPRRMNEEEEQKSPITTRLRSLTRLLSRDRKISPCSPGNVDLEQGSRGLS